MESIFHEKVRTEFLHKVSVCLCESNKKIEGDGKINRSTHAHLCAPRRFVLFLRYVSVALNIYTDASITLREYILSSIS